MCKSGLYIIKNKINNNIYVGITNNINIRWKHHKDNLIKGYNNKDLDSFTKNKPRVRHHQLYLQIEFNDFYNKYKENVWEEVYEFELIFPVTYKFYNKKSLEKIEDAYILSLRETSNGYYQMTNNELNKKYKMIEKDGALKISNKLEEYINNVVNDYMINKLSYREIAKKYDSNPSSVMRFLQQHEVQTRGNSSGKLKYDINDFKDEIISLYDNQKLNASQIAEKYNTSCGVINSYLKSWNITLRTLAEIVAGVDLENYKNQIINMYINESQSMQKIATYFKVSKPTIKKYLTRWNVKIKSHSDYYNTVVNNT